MIGGGGAVTGLGCRRGGGAVSLPHGDVPLGGVCMRVGGGGACGGGGGGGVPSAVGRQPLETGGAGLLASAQLPPSGPCQAGAARGRAARAAATKSARAHQLSQPGHETARLVGGGEWLARTSFGGFGNQAPTTLVSTLSTSSAAASSRAATHAIRFPTFERGVVNGSSPLSYYLDFLKGTLIIVWRGVVWWNKRG
jgi:hypothetical protein